MPAHRRKKSNIPRNLSAQSFASSLLLTSSDDEEVDDGEHTNHALAKQHRRVPSQTVEFNNISSIREDNVEDDGLGLRLSSPSLRRGNQKKKTRTPTKKSIRSRSDNPTAESNSSFQNSNNIDYDTSRLRIVRRMYRLSKYGGDYYVRFPIALRSAIGPAILFSALKIPDQEWVRRKHSFNYLCLSILENSIMPNISSFS